MIYLVSETRYEEIISTGDHTQLLYTIIIHNYYTQLLALGIIHITQTPSETTIVGLAISPKMSIKPEVFGSELLALGIIQYTLHNPPAKQQLYNCTMFGLAISSKMNMILGVSGPA